jgi:hypothetical protein
MKATELKSKKITLATLKAFIKNSNELFVEEKSNFNGMIDCVESFVNTIHDTCKQRKSNRT